MMTWDDRTEYSDERRKRLATSFRAMMVEAGIDVDRGIAAFLAYTRWHCMSDVSDDHWMDCPYPGAVIEALTAYEAAAETNESEDSAEVVTLTRAEADRIAQRLEFDASWDKCGDGYYSIKRQLGTLAATRSDSTLPSPISKGVTLD